MKIVFKCLIISLYYSTVLSCTKDVQPPQPSDPTTGEILLVGTDKRSITPSLGLGIKMSGYSGRTDAFSAVHDELFVRTLVITDQDDDTTTIHCSVDQLNFGGEHLQEIHKRIISEIMGLENLPLSNLAISATHTHGGPKTGNPLNYEQRNEKVFESIKQAYQNKREARMRIGATEVSDVNVNRQNPHQGPNDNFVCSLEVNTDGNSNKTAQFVEFIDLQDKSMASMFTFGVHSTVMGQHNLSLTGDLAGYASRYIESNSDDGHVSLFLYGSGGDQSPTIRTQSPALIDDSETGVEVFGNKLGSQILPAFHTAVFVDEINISSIAMPVALQRDYGPQDDRPDKEEVRGIYGIRYSDNFIVVSTPFELFSSTVQELNQNSPFEHSFILSLTNGVAHYIPPDETYNHEPNAQDPDSLYTRQQCYENRTSIFTSSAEGIFKERCTELMTLLKTKE